MRATIGAVLLGTVAAAGDHPTTEEPVARLDGEAITLADVSPEIAFQIYRRQIDIYSLLERAVEREVEERLLAKEAARRGVSVAELLRREVDADAEPATDADIDAYLAQHPEAGGEPGARERIALYLSETRKIERRLALTKRLRGAADYELLLTRPTPPRARLDTEGAPTRGPAAAPVTLVHFASFSSPLSARSASYLRRLEAAYPDRLRWVHRSLPSDRDEVGLMAARLAAQAHERGRFWELHDRLFADGRPPLSPEALRAEAEALDLEAVEAGGTTWLAAVKADLDHARQVGAEREPVVFVNGRYFSSTFPYEKLQEIVTEELGTAVPAQAAEAD